MWDLIVSVPDHCLAFYFDPLTKENNDGISSHRTNQTNCLGGLKFVSLNINSIKDKKWVCWLSLTLIALILWLFRK